MNQIYFAKYLPVEGEIKYGDKVTVPELGIADYILPESAKVPRGWKKVKLFLCSRDIKVGDKATVEWENGDIEVNKEILMIEEDGKIYHFSDGWCYKELAYKVIGEISPQVTWVKDGDEFSDEDDIKVVKRHPYIFHKTGQCMGGEVEGYNEWLPEYDEYQIKCPTCGEFH